MLNYNYLLKGGGRLSISPIGLWGGSWPALLARGCKSGWKPSSFVELLQQLKIIDLHI